MHEMQRRLEKIMMKGQKGKDKEGKGSMDEGKLEREVLFRAGPLLNIGDEVEI